MLKNIQGNILRFVENDRFFYIRVLYDEIYHHVVRGPNMRNNLTHKIACAIENLEGKKRFGD